MRQVEHHEQASMCITTVRLTPETRAEIDRMVHDKYGDAPLRSRMIRELVDLGLATYRAKATGGAQ